MSETRSETTPVARPAGGATAGGGPRPGLALLVLAAAQLMVVLDATIVNVRNEARQMIQNVKSTVTRPSPRDPGPGPAGELGVLFDQSPIAMVFSDRELRTRRTNAAFRRLVGLPDEALTGRRPSETDPRDRIMDTALIERVLAEQVISRGVPVVDVHLESTVAGERRVFSWSAYRVTDHGQVLGVLGSLTDITRRVQAVTALRQANARLDLLQRAGSQIGTTLDIRRTAGELAALAVPELADRVAVDLSEGVLQGEDPPRAGPGALRFRRVAVRDAATGATVSFGVGDLITAPVVRWPAVPFLRGKPLVARNPAEISRQISYAPGQAEAILSRGVHAVVTVPLTARGVTLGVATFARAEHPEPYGEAEVRLVSDLASRAAVHIDNARLYTREHDTAVTLQRSMLPRDIPEVPGLDLAYRYQPASRAAEVGGDWFDVIPLAAGQVGLVVGDVTGHGIHAAAIMGQLRTATATLVRSGCPPDQVMAQLSDVVAAHGDEIGATCLYAVYDLASRRCRLTSAGHLPPALRHPGGAVEFVDVPGGVMLGAGRGCYPATDIDLPPGSVLALYTDGLVEQPGQDIGTGMPRLARALAAGPARSADQLCDSVLASLAPRRRDDITLLLARTTAQTGR
jgi:PAS domain S-box-containing protein